LAEECEAVPKESTQGCDVELGKSVHGTQHNSYLRPGTHLIGVSEETLLQKTGIEDNDRSDVIYTLNDATFTLNDATERSYLVLSTGAQEEAGSGSIAVEISDA
jgi:hypothetical protein